MGDIADMVLDGTLDEETGEYIGDDGPGWPRNMRTGKGFYDYGPSLAATSPTSDEVVMVTLHRSTKIICPRCGRRVKAAGIEQHYRDKHGERT